MIASIRKPAALAVAAVALGLAAGCGSGDSGGEPLPSTVADTLTGQLDAIGARVANGSPGACDDIYAPAVEDGNLEPIDAALADIPADVDPDVRAALEESVDRLKALVDQECDAIREAALGEPVEPEVTNTTTTDVETETTPTETETVTETETTPTDTGEELPPGNGPDGQGPPGQLGGAEAPDEDDG